jgi:hypothetical protein
MSADQLLQFLTQGLFVVIFVVVAARARRAPNRANIDIALLFAVLSLIIAITWVTMAARRKPGPMETEMANPLVMALPYMLLRLLADFSSVRPWIMRGTAAGVVLSTITLFLIDEARRPTWLAVVYAAYFVALVVYVAAAFAREARRSGGVTRRRMEAVAAGSILLGIIIFLAPFPMLLPSYKPVWTAMGQLFGLASGIAYFLGFAPPAILRRAWQEPELRAFLVRASTLPRLPDISSILAEFQRGARESIGATGATIGLWDEDAGQLNFHEPDGSRAAWCAASGETLAGPSRSSGPCSPPTPAGTTPPT